MPALLIYKPPKNRAKLLHPVQAANSQPLFIRSKPPAYTLIATQTPKTGHSRDQTSAPDFTAIIMTLLRLEKYKTDILITINVPHIKGEYNEEEVDLELGKQGRLIGDAVEYSARIWESLKIKDWDLFGEA